MEISIGKNPVRPKHRAWASAMGFSWTEWIDDYGHVLDDMPQLGEPYKIRLPSNFVASIGEEITLQWLPADSSINGFDESNVADLARLLFTTGSVNSCNEEERSIVFQPETFIRPEDLLSTECRCVDESDTLADCQRWEHSFERYKCIEFSMEGDVSSRYIFIDEHLVMLEHCVWGDAHFWIGNGKLQTRFAQKIFATKGE